MKNVYIFSGTKALYETVIEKEIEDLQKKFRVIIIREYNNIPKNKKKARYVNISKKHANYGLLSKITEAFVIKQKILKAFKHVPPHIVVIHSDLLLREWQTIYFAKKLYKAQIIRRAPSPLFTPQQDYQWLKYRGNWLKRTISRILNNYILSYITTGKFNKTNLCWFPTNKKLFKKSKKNFDRSYCYCEATKKSLKQTYEDSSVIRWPTSEAKETPKKNVRKECLLVLSCDHELIAAKYKLNINDSYKKTNHLIYNLVIQILRSGVSCNLKFRNIEDQNIFQNQFRDKFFNYKNKIKFINPGSNIYNVARRFKIIIGFVTTVLWKLHKLSSNKTLISYQLVPSRFYSIFKKYPGIIYVPYNKSITNALIKKGFKKENHDDKKLKSLAEIIS